VKVKVSALGAVDSTVAGSKRATNQRPAKTCIRV